MKDTVLVFGSGRSGTSWLSETMARPRGYRLLFEPEHETHVPEGSLLTDKLLLPGEAYPLADKFLTRLFKNRIDNNWIAQHSYRKYKMHLWPFLVKKKIVKFVRCNLAMHYMANKFQLPSVYIRRDPYTTIHSQRRVNFPWLTDLSKFAGNDKISNEVLAISGINLLNDELSHLQKLTLRWVIENIIPFKFFENTVPGTKLIHLNYETLRDNPGAYSQLLEQLGMEAPQDLSKQLQRPSSKTHPRSHVITGLPNEGDHLFTDSELAEINQILALFKYTSLTSQKL